MVALGRLFLEDSRDNGYPLRALTQLRSTPPAIKFKYWPPKAILDQGNVPQCVGYAWASVHQGSPLRYKVDPGVPGSIYQKAQAVDGFPLPHDGTTVRAAAQVCRDEYHFLQTYAWAQSIDDVIDWVLQHGPIVVGTNWYSEMFQPDTQHIVHPRGSIAGGHAYVVDGYSRSSDLFRCRNSWGTGWGRRGLFWMQSNDLLKLWSEDGEAATSVEI